MSDAMNEPVTRAEFAEFREDLDRRFATKDELREEVAKLATKDELREEVAKLATKDELREEVAKLATRAELHAALDIWTGALRAELEADAQQREERMTATITGTITAHMSTEIARHIGAILERTQTEIGAVDDKYRDVLPRLANVEAQAHTHPEPPPKKATGRRSR